MEELIVLFSREKNLDKIRDVLSDSFGLPRFESGNSLKFGNKNCTIEIEIGLLCSDEETKAFIERQKNTVCGFFANVSSVDDDIKINLCHHIQQSQAMISVVMTLKDEQTDMQEGMDSVTGVILNAMQQLDGVLIIEQGTVALDSEGKVILFGDGKSELESYFPFTLDENPKLLENCTQRQKTRRYENMKYLFDKGIYVCELPMNSDDDEIMLRDKEEIVQRMLGTMFVSLYSEGMLNPDENMSVPEARKFIQEGMKKYSIKKPEKILTPKELAYIHDDNPKEQTMIAYSWNYEHLYVLEWVLGLVEWNDPTEICNVGLMVRNVLSFKSIKDICKKTTMRSKKEILDKADLVYRMDWAAVDARIHGMQGPAGIDHGVIQAQHKVFNWLIRFMDAEWDDVDTPT